MKYRTHTCGELNLSNVGQFVKLSGWAHRYRDHGGVIFIDLRDRFGLVQIVCRKEDNHELHAIMDSVKSEWVICIEGEVSARASGMENVHIKTGAIEIGVTKITVLSKSDVPPFSISDEHININEELRLQYRYLDMRRGDIHNRLVQRHQVVLDCRNFLSSEGFIEVVTPVLGKSTPEGARDYLVPSRVSPGQFYALPQSPQIFKQLLMVGGLDRYFQMAQCFRDEDLRADRQPEFAQIDLEMSFGSSEDLFVIVEQLMKVVFKDKSFDLPISRMSYQDAMLLYGTDKPDLRFGMSFVECSDIASEFDFTVFKNQLSAGGIVKGFKVDEGSSISRKQIDVYTEFVRQFGAMGLVWIKINENDISSNVSKFASSETFTKLLQKFDAKAGDLIFLIAAREKEANQSLDNLRRSVGKDRGLLDEKKLCFSWITDFPMFAEEGGKIYSEHHPFTAPIEEDIHLLDSDPLRARSSSYDLVLNGYEIASGSQRIHDTELQHKIFSILGLSHEQINEKFGFFVNALKFGTPPHLGIALGIERLMMVLTGANSIRDVVAFPKTQKASDLMMAAPSIVLDVQLKDLHINVNSVN